MQVAFFVCLLQNRLVLINVQLKKIATQNRGFTTKLCSSRTLPIFDALLNLKKIYDELHNISVSINKAFGISMLITFINNFVVFTTHCYWTYTNLHDFEKASVFVGVLVPHSISFGILCFYCSTCYQQVSPNFNTKSLKLLF